MEPHAFVIPVYQESVFLKDCIESLLQQTIPSRIVITTSTPSAYTRAVAQQYDLEYYVNPDIKTGIAQDWNFALGKAGTKWATIAHQDDTYASDYTQNLLRRTNSSALIAFTDSLDNVNGKVRGISLNALIKKILLFPFIFNSSIENKFLKKLILSFGDPICCPSVAFNLENLAEFSFSDRFIVVLDWHAWFTLASTPGQFIFVNKKLVTHRIHSDSETSANLLNGIRKKEELEMFSLIWGPTMAKVISYFYTLAYFANRTSGSIER